MRDRIVVEKEIEGIEGKLEKLVEDIEEKQEELSKLQVSHNRLLESLIGKPNTPSSVKHQRDQLVTLKTEFESFTQVKASLESRFDALIKELAAIELYETKVQPFKSQEQKFMEMAEQVGKEIEEVTQALDQCKENMEKWFSEGSTLVDLLEAIVTDMTLANFNLPKLMDGELADGDAKEKLEFVARIAERYKALRSKINLPADQHGRWKYLVDRLNAIVMKVGGQRTGPKWYSTPKQPLPPGVQAAGTVQHFDPATLVPVNPVQQREEEKLARLRVGTRVVNANKPADQ